MTLRPPANKTPASNDGPGNRPRFWLRRSDQVFVGTLLTVAVLLVLVHWLQLSDWGRHTVEVDRLPEGEYQYSVDINQATWVEWAQFDGIGETLAKRIVADRQANGPFEEIDDLRRVKGIGPKKFAEIRPYLTKEAAQATAGK
jgi:competence protein ComEA